MELSEIIAVGFALIFGCYLFYQIGRDDSRPTKTRKGWKEGDFNAWYNRNDFS